MRAVLVTKKGLLKVVDLFENDPRQHAPEKFQKQSAAWSAGGKAVVHLYGTTEGRAGSENKYEFPPPVDEVLYFGDCLLIKTDAEGQFADFPISEWKALCDRLQGGSESLGEEDEWSEDSEEEEEAGGYALTKHGYRKDSFIASSDDEDGLAAAVEKCKLE